jgi:hypothetical protein
MLFFTRSTTGGGRLSYVALEAQLMSASETCSPVIVASVARAICSSQNRYFNSL